MTDPKSPAERQRLSRARRAFAGELAAREMVEVVEYVHRSDVKTLRFTADRLRKASGVSVPEMPEGS
ncbi:MAG: hypothetical protein AAF479_14365 [Pseudomonadota bacterium]